MGLAAWSTIVIPRVNCKDGTRIPNDGSADGGSEGVGAGRKPLLESWFRAAQKTLFLCIGEYSTPNVTVAERRILTTSGSIWG